MPLVRYAGQERDEPNRKPGFGALGAYDARGLNKKVSVGWKDSQFDAINAEAERIGVSFGSVVRRLVDEALRARKRAVTGG